MGRSLYPSQMSNLFRWGVCHRRIVQLLHSGSRRTRASLEKASLFWFIMVESCPNMCEKSRLQLGQEEECHPLLFPIGESKISNFEVRSAREVG